MVDSAAHLPDSILVAEDDDLIRFLASDVLEEQGYRVWKPKTTKRPSRFLRVGGCAVALHRRSDAGRLRWYGVGASSARALAACAADNHVGRKRPSDQDIPDEGRFLPKPYRADELIRQVDDLIGKH